MQERLSHNAIVLIIEKLQRVFDVRTDTKLAGVLGIKQNTVSSWKARRTIDYPLIIAKCDFIDLNWLFSETAESLDPVFTKKNQTKSIENVRDSNPNKNPNKRKVQKMLGIDEVKVITLDTSGTEVIPIVDISAAAGAGAYNPDYVETLDTIRLPSRMLHRGPHNCIRIAGDSMAPTMQDGSYVISRLLDRSEWEYIKTGYIYVVTQRDGETCIKRVRNRLREKGFIVCTSDNPDKEHFRNFNIEESEINTVWEVEWYLSARMPNIHDTYYSRMQTLIDDVDDLKTAVEKLLQKPGKKPV